MKNDTHPQVYPAIFVDSSSKDEFVATSTMKSKEQREVDGTEYQVFYMDVTSASHPFYTGKQRFVDTTGQVDKYQKRAEKVAEAKAKAGDKSKKEKRQARSGGAVTKKDARAALKDALKEA